MIINVVVTKRFLFIITNFIITLLRILFFVFVHFWNFIIMIILLLLLLFLHL